MFIKTKKRGEIEVGGDEEIGKALSELFGNILGDILDEMYDVIVKETTFIMWPDEDLTICVDVGGDATCDHDLKTITLEKLIREAISVGDIEEVEYVKKKLIEIANSI